MTDEFFPVRCCCNAHLIGWLPKRGHVSDGEYYRHVRFLKRFPKVILSDRGPDREPIPVADSHMTMTLRHFAAREGLENAFDAQGRTVDDLLELKDFIPAEPWEIALDEYENFDPPDLYQRMLEIQQSARKGRS